MNIKILGSGCARCKTLEQLTRTAVQELGIHAEIEKVEDIARIMSYGVLQTPGLVINEKLKLSGRLPSVSEVKDLINKTVQSNLP